MLCILKSGRKLKYSNTKSIVSARTMSVLKSRDEERKFTEDVFQMILRYNETNNTGKVIDFKTPDQLAKLIDFSLPKGGENNKTLLELCESTFKYSLNTNHPMYVNQLYAKSDPYGVAADALATSVNTNLHTFEVAPVFVMAEKAVIARSLELFGMNNGEGTFCPGGSYANMLALNLAKFSKFPKAKEEGLFNLPKIALLCSKQSHYSVRKNAVLLGFGTDCVVEVDCEDNGKMSVSDLKSKLASLKANGILPVFLNATAGTTVLGAFDPFEEISNICKEHGVWFHVDGAYGASVIFSNTHKHLCAGIEKADSIAWNAHKMLQVPLQCSVFLTKHAGMMGDFHSFHVPYLFQKDKAYDTAYDIGTNLVQCGRRVDSFKFWLMWKARGDKGFSDLVDKAFDNTKYFISELKKRKNFKMALDNPEFTCISFWYVPPSLEKSEENDEYWKKLNGVAPIVKARMQKEGSILIGYQPLEERINFFRLVVINRDLTHKDMDFILNEFERIGCDL